VWCLVVRGGGTAQGIGRYAEGVIPGVHSDAAAVASSLRGAGWEVQEALDCSRHALLAAVTSLLSTLRAGRHAGRWCVPAPAPQDSLRAHPVRQPRAPACWCGVAGRPSAADA
jgi:hypothetical protein